MDVSGTTNDSQADDTSCETIKTHAKFSRTCLETTNELNKQVVPELEPLPEQHHPSDILEYRAVLNARQMEGSQFDEISSSGISEIILDEVAIRLEKPSKIEARRDPEHRMYNVIKSGFKSNSKTSDSIRMYRVRKELRMRQFNTANIPEDNEYLREAKRIYPQGFVDSKVKHAAKSANTAKTSKTEKLRCKNPETKYNNFLNEDYVDNPASPLETASRSSLQSDTTINSAFEIVKPKNTFFSSEEEEKDVVKNGQVDAEEILQQRMLVKLRRRRLDKRSLSDHIVEMYSLESSYTTISCKQDNKDTEETNNSSNVAFESSEMEHTGTTTGNYNGSQTANETSCETTKTEINPVPEADQTNHAGIQENEGVLYGRQQEEMQNNEITSNDNLETMTYNVGIQEGHSTTKHQAKLDPEKYVHVCICEYLRRARKIYLQGCVETSVTHFATCAKHTKTSKMEKSRFENPGLYIPIQKVKEINIIKERKIYGHVDESQLLLKARKDFHGIKRSSDRRIRALNVTNETNPKVRKRSQSYDSVVSARSNSLSPFRTWRVMQTTSRKKYLRSEVEGNNFVNEENKTKNQHNIHNHKGYIGRLSHKQTDTFKRPPIKSRSNLKNCDGLYSGVREIQSADERMFRIRSFTRHSNNSLGKAEINSNNPARRSGTASTSSLHSDISSCAVTTIVQSRKKLFSGKGKEKTDAVKNVDAEEILQQRMRRNSRRRRRNNQNLARHIVDMYSLESMNTTISSKPDTDEQKNSSKVSLESSKMETTGNKSNTELAGKTLCETLKTEINTTHELNQEVVEVVPAVSEPDQNISASIQEHKGVLNARQLEESKHIPPNNNSEKIIDEVRIQDGNSTLVLYKVREKSTSEKNQSEINSNQTVYNNDLQQIENGSDRSDGKLIDDKTASTNVIQEDTHSDNITYSVEKENSHESRLLKSAININEYIDGHKHDDNSYNSSGDTKPSRQLTSVSENENRENASSYDNLSGQENSEQEKNVSVLDDSERSVTYEGEDNNSLTETTKQSDQNTRSETVEFNQNGYCSDETELSANQSLDNKVDYTTLDAATMRSKRPKHLEDKGTINMKEVTRADTGSSKQEDESKDKNKKIEALNNVSNPRSESDPSRGTVEENHNVKITTDPCTVPYQQGGLQNPSTSKKTSTSLSTKTMSSETRVFLLVEKARQANKVHMNENTQTLDLLQQMRLSLYKELDIMKGNLPEEPPEDAEPDSTETTDNPENSSEHTKPPDNNKNKRSLGHKLSEEKLIEIHDKYWKHEEEVQSPTTRPIVVNQNAGAVKSIKKKASTKIDTKWDPNHPLYNTIQSGFKSNIKIPDSNGMHRAHKEHKELKTKKFNTENIPEDNVYLQEAKRIYPQGFEEANEKHVKHAKTPLASISDNSGISTSTQKSKETHISKERNNDEHTDKNQHSLKANKDVHPLKQSRDWRTRTEAVLVTENTNSKVRKRSHSKDSGDGARSKSSSPLRTRPELQTVSSRKKNLRSDSEGDEKLKAGHYFSEKNELGNTYKTNTNIKNNSHKQNGYIKGLSHKQANKTKTKPIKFSSNSKNPDLMHSDGSDNSSERGKGKSDSPAVRLGNASKSSLQSDISISTAIEIVQSRNKFFSNKDEEKKTMPREHRVYKLFHEIQRIRHMAAPMTESCPDVAENGEMFINDPQSGFLFMNYNQTPQSVTVHKTSSELNHFLSSSFDYEVCSKVKSVKARRRERALEMLRQNIASKS